MTDKCTSTCKDGSECNAYPLEGEDKCRMHIGKNGDSHDGENNPNHEHNAFSDKFRSDLTDAELAAVESLVSYLTAIDDERRVAAECAAEALMKYKRSGDVRFLREARQWMSEFNLLPNEDELNVGGVEGGALEVIVERSEYNDG